MKVFNNSTINTVSTFCAYAVWLAGVIAVASIIPIRGFISVTARAAAMFGWTVVCVFIVDLLDYRHDPEKFKQAFGGHAVGTTIVGLGLFALGTLCWILD